MKVGAESAALSDDRLGKAAHDMEAILLRQMLRSSGAYQGGEGAGASLREDMFVDALAEAVEKAGGLGLADTLTRSLSATAVPSPRATAVTPRFGSAPSPFPSALKGATLPLEGHLTSGFGMRTDPFTGAVKEHDGVDVGAPEGSPIRATSAGIVRSAGARGGYGNAVEIDHGNGLTTLYGHASQLLVNAGDAVQAGQEIARVGSTGRSTGPHLHFEVRVGGRAVDPSRVLKVYASRAETDPRSGP